MNHLADICRATFVAASVVARYKCCRLHAVSRTTKGVAFLVTVTSQPSKAIGYISFNARDCPLVCNLWRWTFGNVTTESFRRSYRGTSWSNNFTLNVTLPSVIALSSAAITLDVAHTTVINAVNTLFFIVIILIRKYDNAF